jgi:hypothetical protein
VSAALLSGAAFAVMRPAAAADPPTVRINFQPASATVPTGYAADTGAAFNGTTGWRTAAGAPLDLTANTRDRNNSASPDQRYDTFIHVQAPAGSGTTTPGRWEHALPDGDYDVTVAVGEAAAVNSVHRITAEPGTADATVIIDDYAPTTAAKWSTQTRRVTVADGFLTLDPAGGTNTKLDFVDIVPAPPDRPRLAVSTPYDAVLGLPRPRLVFSTVSRAATPAQAVTLRNTGARPLTVSGIAVGGTDGTSFALPSGRSTDLTVPAGGSADVGVLFTPTANTNCPTASAPDAIGVMNRAAVLTFSTDDPDAQTVTVDLSGVNSCANEGMNEPVLDQIVKALGYTTVTYSAADWRRRLLGPLRPLPNSDEVQAPYFRAADPTRPVTLTPVAHYRGRTTTWFSRTGWYAKNSGVTTPCNSACRQLFMFAPDNAAPGSYVQNQKLFPAPTGSTTFTPSGPFGVFNGDGTEVNFTDDAKSVALTSGGAQVSPPHYMHTFRAFPAYGPDRTPIPDTWILATDVSRVPAWKNNDFQDVVLVLNNATPEVGRAASPGAASLNRNLTGGGTVSPTCDVTGFDGVVANSAGTQCNAGDIAFTPNGLQLTSTAGELGNGTNSQQNALFNTFDASRTSFTITARVKGPVDQLTSDYQQIAAFFGPDQDNYVKVEAEHNGAGADPHATVFFEENGVGTGETVSVPGLTTATTVDLILKGNTSYADGTPPNTDTDKVRGYPLGRVTASYSINGGTPVQVGTVKAPADVMRWFSTSARGGILVSGGGSSTPFTATFTSFKITN